jgi:hypothetical protein
MSSAQIIPRLGDRRLSRTRRVAFPSLTSAITANVETSVTTRPAEQQAVNDAPITIVNYVIIRLNLMLCASV